MQCANVHSLTHPDVFAIVADLCSKSDIVCLLEVNLSSYSERHMLNAQELVNEALATFIPSTKWTASIRAVSSAIDRESFVVCYNATKLLIHEHTASDVVNYGTPKALQLYRCDFFRSLPSATPISFILGLVHYPSSGAWNNDTNRSKLFKAAKTNGVDVLTGDFNCKKKCSSELVFPFNATDFRETTTTRKPYDQVFWQGAKFEKFAVVREVVRAVEADAVVDGNQPLTTARKLPVSNHFPIRCWLKIKAPVEVKQEAQLRIRAQPNSPHMGKAAVKVEAGVIEG